MEPDGTAWVSGDGGWVAVFNSPDDDPPFRLYCSKCEEVPMGWDPAGRGWEAFERVLTRLDQTVKKPGPLQLKPEPLDPREIRY